MDPLPQGGFAPLGPPLSNHSYYYMRKDITLSLVRDAMPEKFFKEMDDDTEITCMADGIYYLKGPQIIFPTQVIIIKRVDKQHPFLRVLKKGVTDEECALFFESVVTAENLTYRNLEAVYYCFRQANPDTFEKYKEEHADMYEKFEKKLHEEYERDIVLAEQKGVNKGADDLATMLYEDAKNSGPLTVDRIKSIVEDFKAKRVPIAP